MSKSPSPPLPTSGNLSKDNTNATAVAVVTSGTTSATAAAAAAADKNPWLHAWYDPLAGLKTSTQCVRLGDLYGDGDSKLCVCDVDRSLRVYRGTSVLGETVILDVPMAMCIIYSENSVPRIPTIAVAAGSHIFMYRQLRPYKKWLCPQIELSSGEIDIWNQMRNGSIVGPEGIKALTDLREAGTPLSSRSVELLSLDTAAANSFVYDQKDIPLQQNTVITCMDVLKKDSEEHDAVCVLVVGTEAGEVYILPQDPINSSYICKLLLPSAPVLLNVSGLFDVEWRVNITCRDGKLYGIKNGDIRGTAVLSGAATDLGSQPVAITRQDKLIWVACMDRSISSYSNRGKRTKILLMSEDIVDLATISLKRAKVKELLVVALATGEIRVYRDGTLVHSFTLEKPILAMRFGPYGREEHCLIIVHGRGAITVKMWKRTADVDQANIAAGPPPEQDVPLNIPKKTKVYVDQTQREREQAPQIHRTFQRDLCKLRLETARAYVKTLTDGTMVSRISSLIGISTKLKVLC
jgi:Bardet-Biedl syndrome 1 protein